MTIEHEIILKPGTQPIVQRAYTYSRALKNEIENMVKDMLLQDFIQVSSSPFASPSILVKKNPDVEVLC